MPNPDTTLAEALSRKLRQEAEKRLNALSDGSVQVPPGDIDYKKIVEELKIQQAELEIQKDVKQAIAKNKDIF